MQTVDTHGGAIFAVAPGERLGLGALLKGTSVSLPNNFNLKLSLRLLQCKKFIIQVNTFFYHFVFVYFEVFVIILAT